MMKTPFVTKCREGQIWHSDQSRSDEITWMHVYHLKRCSRHTFPNTRIGAALDRERQQLYDRNTHVLDVIVDTMLRCGRQDVSHRGQRDDFTAESLSNRCHFMAILEMAANSDDMLRSQLETGNRNQRHTSLLMVVPMKEEHNSQ